MRFAMRRGFAMLFVLMGGAVVGAGASPAAFADDALDKVMTVDIPAQPLTSALIMLSNQSGTQILTSAGLVGGRSTDGVHGQMSLRDALSGLLKGSSLGFHAAGENTIGIDGVSAGRRDRGGASHGGGDAAASGEAVVAVAETAAPAATPATSATAADGDKHSVSLGEIVVTATKREQSVRKIPATVNVLKGKDLEEIGARDMEDFLKYVPGVSLQESTVSNDRTVSIRGIGPQPGANTTTGALIDDVSMSDPYSSYVVPDLDPFDLHDVEVLKGPQGTLFGASALNGAIRYVPNKPLLGEWEGKGFVDWLSVTDGGSAPTFGGAINIPVGKQLAFRAVDVVQEIPGLYDDVNANGKNDKNSDNGYKRMHRLMGLWQPLDKLSMNAFYLQQVSQRNDMSIANNLNSQLTRTDAPGPSSAREGFALWNVDMRYNLDWSTLISETSRTTKLQDINIDSSALFEPLAVQGIESLGNATLVKSKAITQELRLVSAPGDSPWVWLGGAYLSRYNANLSNDLYLSNPQLLPLLLAALSIPPGSVPPQTSPDILLQSIHFAPLKATEESMFGELTRKLGSASFTVGGRFYRESLTNNVEISGLLAGVAPPNYAGGKSMRSTGFNPKAAATYQVTDNVLWYVNATHGFQFGGLNAPSPHPADQFPLVYKPSTVWSYETGVRTDAFHKTLQFDLTAFLLNWKDMQISQRTPDGLSTYTANISRARSKGLEASVRYLTPIPGLTLINVASYIHAKVAESYTTANGTFIPAGTDLPAAPRLQTATTLVYNNMFGPLHAGAALTFSHQGRAFNDITHDAGIYGYNTLDFNLNASWPNLYLSPAVSLNFINLTNTRALVGADTTQIGNTIEASQGIYNRPRAIAMRISGTF